MAPQACLAGRTAQKGQGSLGARARRAWLDEQKREAWAVSDSIHMQGLLSWYALKAFGERRGYEWLQPYTEPQWVAWLIEILKQSDDDESLFPHGKWATIQHLQGKVAAMAAGERHSRETLHP